MALPIWENHNMLYERVFSRSWRERLFTLPWQPWVDRKTEYVPSTSVYRMTVPPHYKGYQAGFTQGCVVLMCHPMMAERIRARVKQDGRNYLNIVRQAKEGVIQLEGVA